MKIGINDGCANGGMMDSMSIDPMDEVDPDWQPYAICEVSPKQWEEWQKHLSAHTRWEAFWTKRLLDKANRTK